jgi:hypothetical protein
MSQPKPLIGARKNKTEEQGGAFKHFGRQILMFINLKHSWLFDLSKYGRQLQKNITVNVIIKRATQKNSAHLQKKIKQMNCVIKNHHEKVI